MTARSNEDGAAVTDISVCAFGELDRQAVIDLWRACDLTRPWNDPNTDIDRKRTMQSEWFYVAKDNDTIVGSIMFGYDGHRGSVNYLAVHPEFRKQGVGRLLMQRVEAVLTEQGCPKINLMIRKTNLQAVHFYTALGYLPDESVILGKRLIAD